MLGDPDFDKPFQIQSNSSRNAIGAVLLHDKRPAAYFSQKLNPSETNYCISDEELLAACRALVHWRYYVEGRTFSLRDHRPKYWRTTSTYQNASRMDNLTRNISETKACPLFINQARLTWLIHSAAIRLMSPLSSLDRSNACKLNRLHPSPGCPHCLGPLYRGPRSLRRCTPLRRPPSLRRHPLLSNLFPCGMGRERVRVGLSMCSHYNSKSYQNPHQLVPILVIASDKDTRKILSSIRPVITTH
jgi:hypothetical protein